MNLTFCSSLWTCDMCTWRLLRLLRCLPQNTQPKLSPGLACLLRMCTLRFPFWLGLM